MLKDASGAEIISAVRGVAQGEAACPPKLCMTLIQHLSREHRQRAKVSSEQGSAKRLLTYRQLELMDLVARGLSNKEIAANLNLSEFTVKNHMRRIMKQIDAADRHKAVHLIRRRPGNCRKLVTAARSWRHATAPADATGLIGTVRVSK